MKNFIDQGIPKEIIDKVYKEHDFQIRKWGWQHHSIYEWLAFATEELGEVSAVICDYEYDRGGKQEDIVKEAIQAATLLLKIATMYYEEEKKEEKKVIPFPKNS